MESGRCRELSSLPGVWGQSPNVLPKLLDFPLPCPHDGHGEIRERIIKHTHLRSRWRAEGAGNSVPCRGDWGQSPQRPPKNSWISHFHVRTTGMGDKKRIISMPICEADGEAEGAGNSVPCRGIGGRAPTHPQSSWISRFYVRTTGMGDKKKIIKHAHLRSRWEAEGAGNSVPCRGIGGRAPNVTHRKKGTYVFSRSMA